MAIVNYPDVPRSRDTRIKPRETTEFGPMSDGTARGRVMHAKPFYDATIVHTMLTQAQVDILLAHYANHKIDGVLFQYAGRTYELYYAAEPDPAETNGIWRSVTTPMKGNLSPGP